MKMKKNYLCIFRGILILDHVQIIDFIHVRVTLKESPLIPNFKADTRVSH